MYNKHVKIYDKIERCLVWLEFASSWARIEFHYTLRDGVNSLISKLFA